ncbi:unnamed protein product [Staurois parvus]|uniref:Uncharacterized protein n=1 Tax=Staurois parvus TaxID=386267 RepID=A0ABN9AM45_9NEOB|nr:unnamed protein product [Staurois parvus]
MDLFQVSGDQSKQQDLLNLLGLDQGGNSATILVHGVGIRCPIIGVSGRNSAPSLVSVGGIVSPSLVSVGE